MPDVVTAVLRGALNTSTGTQDFTTTDFGGGTPKAAWFIVTTAITDGTAAAHISFSIGAATATDEEWVHATWFEDAVATSETHKYHQTNRCVSVQATADSIDGDAEFTAFITNGVRINVTDAFTAAYLLTVILFGGADLQAFAGTEDTGSAEDAETNVTAPGFEPDVVLGAMSLQNAVNFNANSTFSAGAATNDGVGGEVQRAWGHQYRDAFSGENGGGRYIDDGTLNEASFGGGDTMHMDLDTFDSSGFSIFTRHSSSFGMEFSYLALEFGGLGFDLQTITTPTSTGNASVTGVGFKPQIVLQGMTMSEVVNTSYGTSLGHSWGYSAFTPDAEFSMGQQSEDGVSTTNSQSVSNDQAIVHPLHDGAAGIVADFTSMDTDGWTLDYTTVTGTGKIFWGLAIEEVAAPLVSDPLGMGVVPFAR